MTKFALKKISSNMDRKELLHTNGYWVAQIQIELYNQLSDYMKKHHLNRSQLAEKLGVTKGYVSQILNGDFNHRLSTLVDLSLAMGKAPIIQFSDLDKIIENPPHVSNSIHETRDDTPKNLKAS